MAPNEMITLAARARKLGIDGYRRMSVDELRTAVQNAETGKGKSAAPAKGKTASSNGATVVKGKSTPAKGKTSAAKKSTSKSAPAKSAAKKASPAKGKASQGTAKRSAAARGSVKNTSTKTSTAKRGKAITSGTRAALGKINWNRESNVGTTGKRKDVLDALREHKGDKAAAFKSLKRKAPKFYPSKDKDEAERMLVWLIGRVAYDYAYKTGQHEPAERAAYGTSTRAADVKRREQRAAAHKPSRASKTAGKGRGKASASKGRKTAPVASKGKSKGKR